MRKILIAHDDSGVAERLIRSLQPLADRMTAHTLATDAPSLHTALRSAGWDLLLCA